MAQKELVEVGPLTLREPQQWDPQIPSLSPELSSCKQLCTQLQANVPPFGKPARRATEQFQSTLALQSPSAGQSACASAWPSAGGTRWIVWIRRNVIQNSIGFSSLAQAATRECSPLNAARPFPSLRVSQHLHLTCLPKQTPGCGRTSVQAGRPRGRMHDWTKAVAAKEQHMHEAEKGERRTLPGRLQPHSRAAPAV